MKSNLFRLAVVLSLSLGGLLVVTRAEANENPVVVNPKITNSLIPREPNFFSEGRKQFEREIQLLLDTEQRNQDRILTIEPGVLEPQKRLIPLEKSQEPR